MSDQPSMMQMLKQARGLQKQMGKAQKKVEKRDVQAESSNGQIQVVCSGKLELKRILIAQEAIDAGDKRVLQDLVTSTVNAALKKAQDMVQAEMAKVAAGMGLPDDALGLEGGGAEEAALESDGGGEKKGRLGRLFGRS
ncbi:MAG: DNA-binding YbaB/EbfC family protein [Hyphomicrobiaceae bacterium]|jgi:DNA-binding YbaB/EbfC family protein